MASTPIDIVKVFYGTFSLMGADKAAQYLAPDFTLVGFTNLPLGRDAWVDFLRALKNAIPNLKVRLENVTAEGKDVRLTETGVGTHVEKMDMSLVGQPEIPASGRPIQFFPSEWVLTISEGKIVRAELVSPPSLDTGVPGMLKAFAARPLPAAKA